MSGIKAPFIRRVVLDNYKSIKHCDVSLGPLVFLVGPNGSGKSNFLDALRFVAECLPASVDQALAERGSVLGIAHRPKQGAASFSIDLEMGLPDGKSVSFRLCVVAPSSFEFQIAEEDCRISDGPASVAGYRVRNGKLESSTFTSCPPASNDRLYLTAASSFPEFRAVFDLLRGMEFHSIDPEVIREDTFANAGVALRRNGAGVGTVLRQIAAKGPTTKQRIDDYLRTVLPDFDQVLVQTLEEFLSSEGLSSNKKYTDDEHLMLRFVFRRNEEPIYFSTAEMSDGTLCAFGILVALFQCLDRPPHRPIPLVGIEEPEARLHPAAAGVLFDALHEASHFTQVLVTTHSADLLDIKDLSAESLLIVDFVDGETVIGPADEVSKSSLRDRLTTAGDLLRQNQLRPEIQTPGPVGVDADER